MMNLQECLTLLANTPVAIDPVAVLLRAREDALNAQAVSRYNLLFTSLTRRICRLSSDQILSIYHDISGQELEPNENLDELVLKAMIEQSGLKPRAKG